MTHGSDPKANGAHGGQAVQIDLFGFTRPARLRDHPLFMVWYDMQRRCNRAHRPDYRWYGGRGITVDPVWNSARAFIQWAEGNGWRPGLDVCRHDVNGPFSPENCRVAPHQQAVLARRMTHRLTNGRPALPVARLNGLGQQVLSSRVRAGWPVDLAATLPLGTRRPVTGKERPEPARGQRAAGSGGTAPRTPRYRPDSRKTPSAAPAAPPARCDGINKMKGRAK